MRAEKCVATSGSAASPYPGTDRMAEGTRVTPEMKEQDVGQQATGPPCRTSGLTLLQNNISILRKAGPYHLSVSWSLKPLPLAPWVPDCLTVARRGLYKHRLKCRCRTGNEWFRTDSVIVLHAGRESGGTGRRARLRISWETVGVRVPPLAPAFAVVKAARHSFSEGGQQ